MGKTGTGKSSLLNYLTDNTIQAPTGTGKPVTGEGIYHYVASVDGQKVNIYDSWGIEAGKTERWEALIENSLRKDHGVDKSPRDWFHSVIYCIQGSGHRIEDIDIKIINKFYDSGYHVVIAITKADDISEDEYLILQNLLMQHCNIPSNMVVGVCSVKKEKRGGVTSNPFGIEDLKKIVFEGWKRTVINHLPERCIRLGQDIVKEFSIKIKNELDSKDIGWFDNSDELKFWLSAKFNNFSKELWAIQLPNIIQLEVSEVMGINQAIAKIIKFDKNIFHYSPSFDFFALLSAMFIPIYHFFFRESSIRKDLANEINNYEHTCCAKIRENEIKIREEVKKMMSS